MIRTEAINCSVMKELLELCPEAEENGLDVGDDTNDKENNEDHKDMVELVKRYAPVFKLS